DPRRSRPIGRNATRDEMIVGHARPRRKQCPAYDHHKGIVPLEGPDPPNAELHADAERDVEHVHRDDHATERCHRDEPRRRSRSSRESVRWSGHVAESIRRRGSSPRSDITRSIAASWARVNAPSTLLILEPFYISSSLTVSSFILA